MKCWCIERFAGRLQNQNKNDIPKGIKISWLGEKNIFSRAGEEEQEEGEKKRERERGRKERKESE